MKPHLQPISFYLLGIDWIVRCGCSIEWSQTWMWVCGLWRASLLFIQIYLYTLSLMWVLFTLTRAWHWSLQINLFSIAAISVAVKKGIFEWTPCNAIWKLLHNKIIFNIILIIIIIMKLFNVTKYNWVGSSRQMWMETKS